MHNYKVENIKAISHDTVQLFVCIVLVKLTNEGYDHLPGCT